ncbi:MAG: hypothetical protein IKL42_00345 [Clostridia bacterium]|nr:hypothetical protein [Clostridia bacterium]MBR3575835.1 hypothetical protein [Clostridia bacterium]
MKYEDMYLDSLYKTLELCDLIIANADRIVDKKHVEKAYEIKKETEENIVLRKRVLEIEKE